MMPQLLFVGDKTPLSKPEDVIPFLAKKEKHWKEGRSAYEAAYSWFTAKDVSPNLPPKIWNIIKDEPAYAGAVLEKAIFEKDTKLDDHGRDSQTDILAHLKTDNGRAVLGVEAKVDESFGLRVREWNDYGTGKLRRLVGLLDLLEFKSVPIGELRYQLFHRTAATLLEARDVGAFEAAMVVQSFDKGRAGYEDFVAFADAFGTPISSEGRLSRPKKLGEVTIRLGWTENPLRLAKS